MSKATATLTRDANTTSPQAFPDCPPWCTDHDGADPGDGALALTGRHHERALLAIAVEAADEVTDRQSLTGMFELRLYAERLDDPDEGIVEGPRVVLDLARHDPPRPDQVDVAKHTEGLSDRACRHLLAQYIAGVYDHLAVTLNADEMAVLVAAAYGGARILRGTTRLMTGTPGGGRS